MRDGRRCGCRVVLVRRLGGGRAVPRGARAARRAIGGVVPVLAVLLSLLLGFILNIRVFDGDALPIASFSRRAHSLRRRARASLSGSTPQHSSFGSAPPPSVRAASHQRPSSAISRLRYTSSTIT